MTEAEPVSIFSTPDHCPLTGRGVEVCIACDDEGRPTSVAIINDGMEEMVELDPAVALAAARSLVAALEGRVGIASFLN